MANKELVMTFENKGQGYDELDKFVETIKADKAKKNFRLPRKFNKVARVTFADYELNYDDGTIEIWKMSGVLVNVTSIPFSNPSMLYEIKTDDGQHYAVERKLVIDFEISDREGVDLR